MTNRTYAFGAEARILESMTRSPDADGPTPARALTAVAAAETESVAGGRTVYTAGRRTRVRPGRLDDYLSTHARVPAHVMAALQECGVLRWHIWHDADSLFHSVETSCGYLALLERFRRRGPVDPEWDARIASILDPDGDVMLPLAWAMSGDQQGRLSPAGEDGAPR